MQAGNLFGASLVDAVLVAGLDRLVIDEGNLVLAQVALTLGRLDPQTRPVHPVADVAHQRLDLGAAQD